MQGYCRISEDCISTWTFIKPNYLTQGLCRSSGAHNPTWFSIEFAAVFMGYSELQWVKI